MNRLWDAYTQFHRAAVTTQDVDPVYPVLRHLTADLDDMARVEAVVIYVAYYDLGSALVAWQARRDGASLADLPPGRCGTERRAHRDRQQFYRHTAALAQVDTLHGGLAPFLREYLSDDPRGSWTLVRRRIEQVHGNGRWASYKTAELLQKVAGWPVDAPDMGMDGATGPAAGLRLLGASQRSSPATLERMGATVARQLATEGLPGTELSTVETTLCDFHALVDGRYYVGHDIDQMQEQLNRAPRAASATAFAARAATLPPAYLGERNGWTGVDRDRCRLFRDLGVIRERHLAAA